jgi:hypothetical protein
MKAVSTHSGHKIIEQMEKMLISFLPSSDVLNDVIVSSPKSGLFPAATDILYVVNEVRLFKSYSLTLSVVVFRIRELFLFSLIKNPERRPVSSPLFLGSSQDILTLLDVIFVTVRFVGLSGNRARKEE